MHAPGARLDRKPAGAAALPAKTVVLATDLDGTFLGGTDAERAALYDFIEDNRETLGLVFVTGRDIAFASGLADRGETPRPDMIIGDVGTTVVCGVTKAPFDPVQSWIDANWPGAEAAETVMARHPALRRQPVFGERRVSFYFDDQSAADAAAADIEAAGYDALTSDDLYFDILPRGVQKGPTLRRVADALPLAPERVLAAGDTLNDFSLLTAGFPAVAVANSEPKLVARLKGHDAVYRAAGNGAAGVFEALQRRLEALSEGDRP